MPGLDLNQGLMEAGAEVFVAPGSPGSPCISSGCSTVRFCSFEVLVKQSSHEAFGTYGRTSFPHSSPHLRCE